jgi:hypothetical protein
MRYIVRNGTVLDLNGWYVYDTICHFAMGIPGDQETAKQRADELNQADKLFHAATRAEDEAAAEGG